MIDLWSFDLDRPATAEEAASLAPREVERAARFALDRDSDRYVAGRARLRAVLGRYLGFAPAAVDLSAGAFGKPCLAVAGKAGLRFNLSHCDATAVLAVSDAHEIGIDIEAIGRVGLDEAALAFAPQERAALVRLDEADRPRAACLAWTRKEAFLKAIGRGLSEPPDAVVVALDIDVPGATGRLLRCPPALGRSEGWRFLSFAPGPGLLGSVAVESGDADMRLRRRSLG